MFILHELYHSPYYKSTATMKVKELHLGDAVNIAIVLNTINLQPTLKKILE